MSPNTIPVARMANLILFLECFCFKTNLCVFKCIIYPKWINFWKMKKIISTNLAPSAIGTYSQAVSYSNLLFISGQISIAENGELIKDYKYHPTIKMKMKV